MKQIVETIFDFSYHLPWSDDTLLEETAIFLLLQKQTFSIQPKVEYLLRYSAFDCALKILAIEFLREDDHGKPSAESVESALKVNIERLKYEELCSLSDYLGLYSKLHPAGSTNEYFLTAIEGEQISYTTICSQILLCLLKDIERELEKLKVFLTWSTSKESWYSMFEIEDTDTNGKERVDLMVKSILR
jgi:hypothetical protein